jgi:hypothetical protein
MQRHIRRTRLTLTALAGVFGLVVLGGCAAEAAEQSASTPEPVQLAAVGGEALTIKVYKSPTCGCCAKWIEHLEAAGFEVEVQDSDAMALVKAEAGVPTDLQSCHTGMIGDYWVEGHVPAETLIRFLEEAPDAEGLAVPGMPVGSPGMEMGGRVDPYDVVMFDGTSASVYESRR